MMKKENTRWDNKGIWGKIRDYKGRGKGLLRSPIIPYIPLLSLIALFLLIPQAQGASKGNDPVAYWRFDEGGGPTAYDDYSSNYDATLSAGGAGSNTTVGQMWTSGKIGNALECDGTNDYADHTDFTIAKTSSWSFSMWQYKPTGSGTTWQGFIGKSVGSTGGYWMWHSSLTWYQDYYDPGGGYEYYGYWNSDLNLGDEVPYDEWYHLAVTYNGSDFETKAYINGVLKETKTATWSPRPVSQVTFSQIGMGGGSRFFEGNIDDVKVYDYIRTADQIMVDYNAGSAAHVGSGADPNEGTAPKLYLPFDENTGTTVYDRSGNDNNGSFSSAPTWVAGKYGSALSFDGTDDYVDVGGGSAASIHYNNQTIALWFKSDDTLSNGTRRLFDGNYIGIYYDDTGAGGADNTLFGFVHDGTAFRAAYSNDTVFNAGVWYHVAVTWDNSTVKLYINGQKQANENSSYDGTIGTSSDQVGIGADRNGGSPFDGLIDDVKVYNYARTQAQIAYDYNKGRPIAHYRFDEGTGTIAHNDYSSADAGSAPVGWWKFQSLSAEIGSDATVSLSGSFIGSTGTTEPGTTSLSTDVVYSGTASQSSPGSNAVQVPAASWTTDEWVGYQVSFYYKASTGWPDQRTVTANTSNALTLDGNVTLDGDHTIKIKDRLYYSISYTSADQMTWEIYFKVIDQSGRYFRGANDDIGIYPSGANLGFFIGTYSNPVLTTTGVNMSDGNFHHVVLTYDDTSGAWTVYVDGAQKGSGTTDAGYLTASETLRIGARNDGEDEFSGMLVDDIKIYDYIRSSEEVYETYNNTHGTLVADTKFVDGKVGKALEFDGTGDYVNCGNDASFECPTVTIEAWIKQDVASNRDPIVATSNTAGGDKDHYLDLELYSNNKLLMLFGDGTNAGDVYSTGTITDTDWHHVAVVRDDSAETVQFFIDGAAEAVKNYATSLGTLITLGSDDLTIGSLAGSIYFDGKIDDVRIYNYARTAAQIKQDYDAGAASRHGAQQTGVADPWGGAMPVAHWKLDENTGVLARDASENNKDGLLGRSGQTTEIPAWTQGKLGPCLKFDGTNDCVDITSFTPPTGAVSVCAWFKTTSKTTTQAIAGKTRASYTTYGFGLQIGGSKLRGMYSSNNSEWYDNLYADINNDQWHFGVVTFDGGNGATSASSITGKLYLDSVLKTTHTGTTQWYGPYDFFIGASHHNGYENTESRFTGSIDDVRVYDYALTQAQVSWLYNKGEPVAYYRFDESSGTDAYDDTGNNNATVTIGGTGSQTTIAAAHTASATGKFGRCMSFDGTDDYASCGDVTPMNSATKLTLTGWFKQTALDAGDMMFAKGDSTTNNTWIYTWTDGYLYTDLRNGSTTYGNFDYSSVVTAGKWFHYAMVYNGAGAENSDKLKVYIDGVEITQDFYGTLPSSLGDQSTKALTIGTTLESGNVQHKWAGSIDEVRVYNYCRTAAQVMQDFNAGAASRLGD